jgi:hypothetical protein
MVVQRSPLKYCIFQCCVSEPAIDPESKSASQAIGCKNQENHSNFTAQQTNKQTNRQTNKQASKQANKQTRKETNKQTNIFLGPELSYHKVK